MSLWNKTNPPLEWRKVHVFATLPSFFTLWTTFCDPSMPWLLNLQINPRGRLAGTLARQEASSGPKPRESQTESSGHKHRQSESSDPTANANSNRYPRGKNIVYFYACIWPKPITGTYTSLASGTGILKLSKPLPGGEGWGVDGWPGERRIGLAVEPATNQICIARAVTIYIPCGLKICLKRESCVNLITLFAISKSE